MPISFIAEYEDGSTARFFIDRAALRDGNHTARIVAIEKQRIGRLKPGNIVSVRRDSAPVGASLMPAIDSQTGLLNLTDRRW